MPVRIINDYILEFSSYKEEIEKIVREAENIIRGDFIFNNVWDMEVCDEIVSNPMLDWNVLYKGDPEWAYMFVRFDYSYKLIIAYEIKNDFKFIEFGLNFIEKWFKDNQRFLPHYLGKIANKLDRGRSMGHRTLDIAIFACNSADFILYCIKNSLDNSSRLTRIKRNLIKICKYVSYYDSEFKLKSNWGIMENAYSLYVIKSLNLKIPAIDFLNRLQAQLDIQLREDGSHVESSPMYLVEIILSLLKYMQINNEVTSTSCIYNQVKTACDYIYYLTTPDGCIPNIGDSDKVNVSDLMIIATSIFKDTKYIYKCNRDITVEYIYKYKMYPLNVQACINSESFESHSFCYQSIIADKNTWLLCNNIPYGPSGHKHYDFLSVLLYINNKEFIIDGGRETYRNIKERKINKDAVSHASVRIDGEKYWKYRNSWYTENSVEVGRNTLSKGSNGIQTVKMECYFGKKITLTRIVNYIPQLGILFYDRISGGELAQYEAFFPLSPIVKISVLDKGYKLSIDEFDVYYSTNCENTNIYDISCSHRYNSSYRTKEIVASTMSSRAYHVFLFKNSEVKVYCDDEKITIVEKFCSNQNTYYIGLQ